MPRFKPVDHGLQFLAVDLSQQLHPGSFEYALHHLIEHEIDLTEIEARYKQRGEGALGLRPAGAAQDRAAGLLARDHQLAGHGSGLLPRRAVHGDLGQQRAALQHAGQLREQPGRRRLARSSPRCSRSAIARG